jgi:hypothetical protein
MPEACASPTLVARQDAQVQVDVLGKGGKRRQVLLLHNERVKLIATGFNNIGVASLVAGFVAPVFAAGTSMSTRIDYAVLGMVFSVSAASLLTGCLET